MQPIDVSPTKLETVREILGQHVPELEVRAFGSRVGWTARETSDLDLALMTDAPLDIGQMVALKAAFTKSNLPFRVDIVDWASTSESFRKVIESNQVVLMAARGGSEWVECRLADACSSIDYGLTASATPTNTGTRFLRITDIVSGHIDWKRVPHVIADEATAHKYRLHDGDIVLARTGASTGTSCYIASPPSAVFASYLVRLRTKAEFDSRFLAYYLKSENFRSFIRGVLGDKSAQPNASASTMAQAPIRAPRNKHEQRAIAHILGTLDDKIELNRLMNETLEAMAQALFKSWFVDFDPVRAKIEGRWRRGESLPGLPAEYHDLFPDRLVDSELGETPEGWTIFSLNELALHHTKSMTPSSLPEVEFEHFSIPAHDAGLIPAIDRGTTIKSNKVIVPAGAVLLSKLNPKIPRVWMPDTPNERLQICSTEFLAFTPRSLANRALLFSLFIDPVFQTTLQSMVTGTSSSHQRVPPKALKSNPVLSGTRALFDLFDGFANPMLARVLKNRAESCALAALRDTLLPKLVSSEVRVKRAARIALRDV